MMVDLHAWIDDETQFLTFGIFVPSLGRQFEIELREVSKQEAKKVVEKLIELRKQIDGHEVEIAQTA